MAERKRSQFGQGPSFAPVAQPPQDEAVVPTERLESPTVDPKPTEAPKKPTGPTGAAEEKKVKVGFYMLPSENQRARAAWMNTMGHTGHTKITQFMEAAIAEYTRKLESEYNDSKPFL